MPSRTCHAAPVIAAALALGLAAPPAPAQQPGAGCAPPPTASAVAPSASLPRTVVLREAPGLVRLHLREVTQNAAIVDVRLRLGDGRRIDARRGGYSCVTAGTRAANAVRLSTYGRRRLRRAPQPRVRVSLTLVNASGRRRALRGTLTVRPAPKASAAGATARCRAPARATVAHRSSTVIVHRRVTRSADGSTTRHWGCLRATGRRTTLTTGAERRFSGRSRSISSFRSNGRHVAFVVDESDARYMTATTGIRVFDLRAGRPRRGIALDVPGPGSAVADPLRLRGLILTAWGTAAWRERGRRRAADPARDRIAARDLQGRRRVLQTARLGRISGLRLVGGTTAEWRNGSALHRRRIDRLGR